MILGNCGCGQFSKEFSHYAPCPKNVSDDVIAKANPFTLTPSSEAGIQRPP